MRTYRGSPDIKVHLLRQVEFIALHDARIVEPVTVLLALLGVHDFPVYLGLPAWLAEAEPLLHAGLSDRERQHWPRRFLEAIPVGLDVAELDRLVLVPFLASVPAAPGVPVGAALAHVEPARLGMLAGELLGLLQWLGPEERGDPLLRAVQAAG